MRPLRTASNLPWYLPFFLHDLNPHTNSSFTSELVSGEGGNIIVQTDNCKVITWESLDMISKVCGMEPHELPGQSPDQITD